MAYKDYYSSFVEWPLVNAGTPTPGAAAGTADFTSGTASPAYLAGFRGAAVYAYVGELSGTGTVTPVAMESADGVTFGTAASTSLMGAFTAVGGAGSATTDVVIQRVGYKGTCPYLGVGFRSQGTPNVRVVGWVQAGGDNVNPAAF